MRFIVSLGVLVLVIAASQTRTEIANAEVTLTWKGGTHFLPASATQSGQNETANFKENESFNEWAARLSNKLIKPNTKVPAVIYSHGCKGPTAASSWAVPFNEFGFVFFAPDSFKRPGRKSICYKKGVPWRVPMRHEEIRFALKQIKKLNWIDQNRIVLVGKSEGGRFQTCLKECVSTVCITIDTKPAIYLNCEIMMFFS